MLFFAEIYFGGEILWSSKTPLIMQSSNETTKYNTITLDSWIIFRDCEVKNLPKESILVLKVCEYDKDQKRKTVSKQTDVCPYCKNLSGTHKLYLVNPPVIPVGIPVTEFGNIDSLQVQLNLVFQKDLLFYFIWKKIFKTNKQISITTDDITNVEKIILTTNLLGEMTQKEKNLVWNSRYHILHQDKLHSHPSNYFIFFANNATRKYAVDCLAQCSDENLATIMMQLIQSLKFEASPSSDLAGYSLVNESELHIPETQRRFALLLEAYLLSCGDQRIAIKDQLELCNKLSSLYTK
ncbi:Phosphatidylinositol 3-kinase catalytic subunit gamma [Entamoeba marina]